MEIITSCRVCGSKDIIGFFDLGEQPLANSLLHSPDEKEDFYPLSLSYCKNCSLIQLNQTVEPEKLFSQYVWVTGTSKTANEFADRFCVELIKRTNKPKKGYILELASNDGTFLKPFQKNGYEILGVDPAKNIAKIANSAGIPTRVEFWGNKFAQSLLSEKGPAKMVFARNVLPHVANTHDFMKGLCAILANDGTLAIEIHYAKIILEGLHYDSIYHEHLCYFTFKSLERLLNGHGLYVFDIITSPISGGSIIVYVKKNKLEEKEIVQKYRDEEAKKKINELSSWKNFTNQSFLHRKKLLGILREVERWGLVVGYGASARSSTMLNFYGIDYNILPVIADQNVLKQGKFTAGTHILIESPEAVMARNPQFVFILAWNFTDEIIKYLGGEFSYHRDYIIPLPGKPYIKKS